MGIIRHDAWTDFELTVLQGLVNDVLWFEQASKLIGRSEAAIRAKMCALRRDAGIVQRNPGPTAKRPSFMLRQHAANGSERLRVAIGAVAA